MTATAKGLRVGRKKAASTEKKGGLAIRGSQPWLDWVMRFAEYRRLRATDLIDQALIDSAEKHGFKEPAPKR